MRARTSKLQLWTLLWTVLCALALGGVANAQPGGDDDELIIDDDEQPDDDKPASDRPDDDDDDDELIIDEGGPASSGGNLAGATALTEDECDALPRANPFFGVVGIGPKLGIVFGIFLLVYLLAIAIFRARVRGGGGIAGAFKLSIGMVLFAGLVAAWLGLSEYTWDDDWCERLPLGTTVGELGVGEAMAQTNWLIWGLAALGVVVLFVVASLMVGSKKPAPAPEVG